MSIGKFMNNDDHRKSWMEFYKKMGTTEHMSAGEVRARFQEWLDLCDLCDRWVSVSHWGMFRV